MLVWVVSPLSLPAPYQTLRKARAHKRLHKFRVTKAKKKADEEKNAPKKK